MQFNTPVIDLIKERKSKRTYVKKELSNDLIEQIQHILKSYTTGPFGNHVKFSLIKKDFANGHTKVKIGTYGFISGAQYFIAGEVKNNPNCFEDFGFLLEKIILHLTELNLGTCWLGGTFSRSIISDILNSDVDTIIPAITPVGYVADSKTIRENIIRWAAKSDNRLEWNMLFFMDNFSNPIKKEEIPDYEIPIEMVRLAPSASNKQPWRIVKINNDFHFFLKRTAGYRMFGGVDLQRVDMGIAMSHFELACQELDLKGKWEFCHPSVGQVIDIEYIVSWRILSS